MAKDKSEKSETLENVTISTDAGKKKVKEDKMSVGDFCVVKGMHRYWYDSLSMSFPKDEKRTAKDWEKTLIEKQLVKKEIFNK